MPQFLEKTKGNDHVFIDYSDDPLKANAGFLTPFGRYCSKDKTIFSILFFIPDRRESLLSQAQNLTKERRC